MIKIIDNFLDDTENIDWLYNYFKHTGSYQFDFMSKTEVNRGKHDSELESRICNLIKSFCSADLAYIGEGYEPWVNVLDRDNDHLHHHVDCSEEEGKIVPAKLTASLYLGPSEGLEGGEIAINVNSYTEGMFKYDTIYDVKKDLDSDWIVIPYKYNRMIMFDSTLTHAVLPIKNIKPNESRITFVAACWDKKIKVKK